MRFGILRLTAAALLLAVAWVVAFWGLMQLDVPLIRFQRSVHLRWLERLGDIGGWLGWGPVVAAICLTVVAAGFMRGLTVLRDTGIRALAAQLVSGGLAEALKFLIGRPRPRMMHGQEWQWGPSFTRGLESLPSGHTSIAFAVATVFAGRYPRIAWPAYLLAGFVAASRVIRGSHFPTDVMAGATLGVIIGRLAVHPLAEWRQVIIVAWLDLTPYLAAGCILLWTIMTPPAASLAWAGLPIVGLLVLFTGLLLRLRDFGAPFPWWSVCGLGLALSTGSNFAAMLAVLVIAAISVRPRRSASLATPVSGWRWASEGVLLLGVAIALHQARGILPLLSGGG